MSFQGIDGDPLRVPESGSVRPDSITIDKLPNLPSINTTERDIMLRRQKPRSQGPKRVDAPSRFHGLSVDHEWEFADWGSSSYLELSSEELVAAERELTKKATNVGLLRGSSLSGNSMTSSVFYALPAVVSVASIFSPLSLLVACLILFLWKPIFLELSSAMFVNGANYTYLLQFSGRTMALLGASVTLLDSLLTSTVSAATAASYLQGETSDLVISEAILTIVLLIGLALFCFLNIRSSSSATFIVFTFHGCVMLALMVASVVFWCRNGTTILASNWDLRPRGAAHAAKAIFNGVCVGFLGVTGFETTPTYVEVIRRDAFSGVLKILLITTLLLNGPMMLCVYAVLPAEIILRGTNILSILAEAVAGRWMRTLVVVDCVLVLSGGVIDGICSANALLERLSKDRVFPNWLLQTLPFTGSQYIAITLCLAFDLLLYTCSNFKLATLSSVFTITFLMTLMTFVISILILKFNCDELPRNPRASFSIVILTLATVIILLVGNVLLSPLDLGLFFAYFVVISSALFFIRSKSSLMRLGLWIYCQSGLQNYPRLINGFQQKVTGAIKNASHRPIIVWVGHADIHNLVRLILYIRKNESTAHILLAHAYQHVDSITEELAVNVQLLDEAFPTVTLDLVFVQGEFSPALVEATSRRKGIPKSRMFMFCPSPGHQWEISDYRGIRIIPRH